MKIFNIRTIVVIFFILVVGVTWNEISKRKRAPKETPKSVSAKQAPMGAERQSPVPAETAPTVPVESISTDPIENIAASRNEALAVYKEVPKCTTKEEKILCQALLYPPVAPYGALKKGNVLALILDVTEYYRRARELAPGVSEEAIIYLTTLLLLAEGIGEVDVTKLGVKALHFEVQGRVAKMPELKASFSLPPHELKNLVAWAKEQSSILKQNINHISDLNRFKKKIRVTSLP